MILANHREKTGFLRLLQAADFLGADYDLLLGELALKLQAESLPVWAVQLVGHDLDDRDIVPLDIAADGPQALAGGADEAGCPAKPVCQFVQELLEPGRCYKLAVAGSLGSRISTR